MQHNQLALAKHGEQDELIHELGIVNDLVAFTASTSDLNSQGVLKDLIKNRWKLSELETYYHDFLRFYRPICQKLFLTLPEPDFPAAMLPPGWVGHEAQDLVKRAYKVLAEPSIDYISQKMQNAQGSMPEPDRRFFTRFGSLKPHHNN